MWPEVMTTKFNKMLADSKLPAFLLLRVRMSHQMTIRSSSQTSIIHYNQLTTFCLHPKSVGGVLIILKGIYGEVIGHLLGDAKSSEPI